MNGLIMLKHLTTTEVNERVMTLAHTLNAERQRFGRPAMRPRCPMTHQIYEIVDSQIEPELSDVEQPTLCCPSCGWPLLPVCLDAGGKPGRPVAMMCSRAQVELQQFRTAPRAGSFIVTNGGLVGRHPGP